jgi:hypothetical protein
MAFAGKIPFIGIPGNTITNVAGQAVAQALPSTFVPFVGSSLNQVAGAATQTVLNIGLSSALGAATSKQFGIPLNAGQNFLASQVTPFLTNTLAQGVNVSVTNALKGAGPLAPVLGNLVGQAVSGLAQTALGNLGIPGLGGGGGAGAGAGSGASQAYPGAGGDGEGAADYGGGGAYALGSGGPDVVFSIRPASSPSQIEAAAAAANTPTAAITVTANSFTGIPSNKVFQDAKAAANISSVSSVTGFFQP